MALSSPFPWPATALEQLLDGDRTAGLSTLDRGEDDGQRLQVVSAAALRLTILVERRDEFRQARLGPLQRHRQRLDRLLHRRLPRAMGGEKHALLIPGQAPVR